MPANDVTPAAWMSPMTFAGARPGLGRVPRAGCAGLGDGRPGGWGPEFHAARLRCCQRRLCPLAGTAGLVLCDGRRGRGAGRYKMHFDRKLERMLAMVLRLKELRKRVN